MRPEPRPVQPSTVLAAVQTAARRLRWPAASLDDSCARRSTGGQAGTKGWVCPIEQRDANFDLSSAGPPPMTDLLNVAHTTPLLTEVDVTISSGQTWDLARPRATLLAVRIAAEEWRFGAEAATGPLLRI